MRKTNGLGYKVNNFYDKISVVESYINPEYFRVNGMVSKIIKHIFKDDHKLYAMTESEFLNIMMSFKEK